MLLDNRACLAEIDTLFAKLSRVVDRFFASHLVNNLANARRNISAHYDISNGMFMGTYTVTQLNLARVHRNESMRESGYMRRDCSNFCLLTASCTHQAMDRLHTCGPNCPNAPTAASEKRWASAHVTPQRCSCLQSFGREGSDMLVAMRVLTYYFSVPIRRHDLLLCHIPRTGRRP